MSRRRKTPLPQDMVLWEKVKETISPLKKERLPTPRDMAELLKLEEAAKPTPSLPQASPPEPIAPPTPRPKAPPPLAPAPLAPIEKRYRRALRKTDETIEARIDLHGLTLEAAHGALHGFLARSHGEGKRLVLIITGKGRAQGEGILKRTVPQWLSEKALRDVVLGFEEAGRHHGGAGALYVRLRRKRGRA